MSQRHSRLIRTADLRPASQGLRANTDAASAERLRQIGGIRILNRADGTLVALFENIYRLQRLLTAEPKLTLKSLNVE